MNLYRLVVETNHAEELELDVLAGTACAAVLLGQARALQDTGADVAQTVRLEQMIARVTESDASDLVHHMRYGFETPQVLDGLVDF